MSVKAIFFDLDGTLLPMDQDEFVKAYFGLLAKKLAPHGYDPQALIKGIWAGTEAMVRNDGRDTNEKVFWETFCGLFGQQAKEDEPVFDAFYRVEFQQVRQVCGNTPRAKETVEELKKLGYPLVLATNPIFPAIATQSRIRWAGLEEGDFEFVTTYENSSFCKPNPAYYQEILDKLGYRAEECLMVGNDATEDLAAAKLGMQVFLLTDCLINKEGRDISSLPHGGFDELMEYIEKM